MTKTLLTALLISGVMGADLRVADLTVRPGTMAQVRLMLSEPMAITNGGFVVDFDPALFGDVADVQVFSAAGDAAGIASIAGRRVEVSFSSQAGGVGRLPAMPVATIAVPVLATASAGQVTVALTSTPWQAIGNRIVTIGVQPGAVRLGAEIGIGNVNPGGGMLPVGTVVRVEGFGFSASTILEAPGVKVASAAYVSPAEMMFTLGGTAELTGKTIRARNANGAGAEFISAFRGVAAAGPARDLPIFPLRALSSISSATLPSGAGGNRGFALENPHSRPVTVAVEFINLVGGLDGRTSITLAPGEIYVGPSLRALGVSTFGRAGFTASQPIRAVLLSYPINQGVRVAASEVRAGYTVFKYPEIPLRATPAAISVDFQIGSFAPVALSVKLTASGSSSLAPLFTFTSTAAGGGAWLLVARAPGTTDELLVRADAANLPPGAYAGTIRVTAVQPDAKPLEIPVSLTVSAAPFVKVSGTFSTSFRIFFGDPTDPVRQTFSVTSSGAPVTASILAKTSDGGGWLSVSTAAVTTPATVDFVVNTAGLPDGGYQGTISITAQGSRVETIPIFVTVSRRQPVLWEISPAAIRLSFEAGAATQPTTINALLRDAVRTFAATAETASGADWLQVLKPFSGVSYAVDVRIDPRSLPVGTHAGTVKVTGGDLGNTVELPVTVTIWTGETGPLAVSPPSIGISGQAGSGGLAQQFSVTTSGPPVAVSATWNSPPDFCLGGVSSVALAGSIPQEVTPATFQVSCQGVRAGDYQGTISIRAGTRTAEIPVSVHVDPAPFIYVGILDPPLVGSVVNAGSGLGGPVAAGEYISIHGLGVGGPISFDGVPASALYSSMTQTNVLTPAALTGSTVLRVGTVEMTLPVSTAAPGLFTLDGTGVGQGAVLNEDSSINGVDSAAPRGTVIQIFGTGGGTGEVQVLVGGVVAPVLYSGSSLGLWQVNVRTPLDLEAGARVPLVLSVDGVSTQAGVTAAVR